MPVVFVILVPASTDVVDGFRSESLPLPLEDITEEETHIANSTTENSDLNTKDSNVPSSTSTATNPTISIPLPTQNTSSSCNSTNNENIELFERISPAPEIKVNVSKLDDGTGQNTPTYDLPEEDSVHRNNEKGDKLNSDDANKDDENDESEMMSLIGHLSLELVTKHVLDKMQITDYSWTPCEDSKMIQVQFVEGDDERAELILIKFIKIGIGKIEGSAITMIPASIHMQDHKDLKSVSEEKMNNEFGSKEKKLSEFKKSIKARLTVAQVVEGVRANAKLTFDFLMLIILASLIAAMGLVENNSVVLVASMLISPLMGPILAGTFGTVVHNASLRNLGLKNEVIGLSICLGVGFIFGIISGSFSTNGALWGATCDYPTREMKNRGVLRSLWTGLLIAIPSGAGVALSVLGGNAGSLVGVAISASLLPPAVNAGMLWAYSLITAFVPPANDMDRFTEVMNSSSSVSQCPPLLNNTYTYVYSCNMAKEALILGLVSLFLTLLNIVCIVIMAIVVLKIKEVAPNVTSIELTKDFWKRDIKIARDSYKTLHGVESEELAKRFRDEWRALNKDESKDGSLNDILADIKHDDTYRGIICSMPSSPYPGLYERQFSDNAGIHFNPGHDPSRYHTIHGLPNSYHQPSDTFHPRHRKNNFLTQNLPSGSGCAAITGETSHKNESVANQETSLKRTSLLDFFRKPRFTVRKVDEPEKEHKTSRFSLFHKRHEGTKKFIVTQVDEGEIEKQQMIA
ncbi:uncharacterized protein LOC141900082 [Tubulanus polymorphus]|uniref:uncharacterized protein LOC141900082 n=1 Tax=Tubulanus polymorphus TaxID=672921 RepID=UPI003DA228D4